MTIRAVPIGIGHYLPDTVFENKDFEGKLDTSDEWIRSRTGLNGGISRRRAVDL